jgi:hypothetical protein
MLHYWLLREPSLSFSVPVFLCAALLFPLHLGWIGASPLDLVAYLAIAAVLFSITDSLLQPELYRRWDALIPQALLSMLALAVPAALAFAVGSLAGPVDEASDEEACASRGMAEVDTLDAESDDTFDVTADCAAAPQ